MRFILTATLLLFFAQPSYAETQPSYAQFFESEKYCYYLANQANFWVEEVIQTHDLRRLKPEKSRKYTEDISQFIEEANNYAGIYSAFCK